MQRLNVIALLLYSRQRQNKKLISPGTSYTSRKRIVYITYVINLQNLNFGKNTRAPDIKSTLQSVGFSRDENKKKTIFSTYIPRQSRRRKMYFFRACAKRAPRVIYTRWGCLYTRAYRYRRPYKFMKRSEYEKCIFICARSALTNVYYMPTPRL